MSRLVVKFGGTSLANPDRIARVARHVAAARAEGHAVCVTVSAMAGETDRLLGLADAVSGDGVGGEDERDVVAAAGEQASAGLTALALRRLGVPARSFMGWQAGVRTTGDHARARIEAIDADAVAACLDRGEVAVVAGFQGITPDGRITTLGRGGTDTSAVALAAALGAARCDIYTDVDGVYTTDPRLAPDARRIDRISYDEMLELASQGAKVLQTRSVELAKSAGVTVRVVSSLTEPGAGSAGTLVCAEEPDMERRLVSSVAYARAESRITVFAAPAGAGSLAAVLGCVADTGANVDMILSHGARDDDRVNIAFTLADADRARALEALEACRDRLAYDRAEHKTGLAKVSIVGVGMRSHPGVAGAMFAALSDAGVPVDAVTTSEIKITALIPSDDVERAVRALHAAFDLAR